MKEKEPRLFEYRIKYNAESTHSALDNYHYYNAFTASQALDFHDSSLRKNNLVLQTLSVEKFNPYSNKWEDKSEILTTTK